MWESIVSQIDRQGKLLVKSFPPHQTRSSPVAHVVTLTVDGLGITLNAIPGGVNVAVFFGTGMDGLGRSASIEGVGGGLVLITLLNARVLVLLGLFLLAFPVADGADGGGRLGGRRGGCLGA